MKKIAYLAGGLSAAISVASFGHGYASLTDAPVGTAATERHLIQFTTEASDCPVLAVCAAAASIGSEFRAVLEVTNTTTCSSATGTCTPANVADTYAGTGGSATTGAAPGAPITDIHLPGCPVGSAPCLRDVPLTTSFADWNFTTDANGALASGYLIADSSFATSGTVGVFLIDEGIARTYRGVATDLNVACATDINQDFTTCWNNADPATGPSAEQHFDYVTVPTDYLLEKSVPVPAFAAAVLGLGLAAVTVLTGRRRQVK